MLGKNLLDYNITYIVYPFVINNYKIVIMNMYLKKIKLYLTKLL